VQKKWEEFETKENLKPTRKQDKPVRSKRKDIAFSDDAGPTKKEKQEKYLTINALINHPYFGNTSKEVDVTMIIDEFEKFKGEQS